MRRSPARSRRRRDYNWRGVTQTAQDPALQGSLDFSTDMGLHGGAWASNVDFGGGDPNVEIDLYAGWGGGETFLWDVGVLYYTYPGASDLNFTEFYGKPRLGMDHRQDFLLV